MFAADGTHGHAGANLHGVLPVGASPEQRVAEGVYEIHLAGLIADRVDVGNVVGDHIYGLLL